MGSKSQGRVGVVNLGVGGYSNDQELLLFQREGKKYDPDVVVLLVYDNDIVYNIRSKYWRGGKPVFALTSGELVLANTPVPPPEPSTARQRTQPTRVETLHEWFNRRSRLYRTARRAAEDNYYLLAFADRIGLAAEGSIAGVPVDFKVYQPGDEVAL